MILIDLMSYLSIEIIMFFPCYFLALAPHNCVKSTHNYVLHCPILVPLMVTLKNYIFARSHFLHYPTEQLSLFKHRIIIC
jgi:hypothetical protein